MAGGGKGASSKGGSSDHKFSVGDVVLAKIKGFPAWPGVLVDGDQVPKAVRAEKPKDKFIIRFFPKADYHFPGPRDLTLLSPEQCRAYASDSHRKDGELKEGYKIAADATEWIRETDETVRAAEKAREEEELEQQENMDQLEDQDEEDVKPTSGKKRSAPASSNGKGKKPKKEPKSSESAPRKSTAAAAVAAPAAAEEDGADGEMDEATRKVRGWRHSLQRAFLPKDREPTEKDVEGQDVVFATVESTEITAEQLRATKINKVMRKIMQMDKIPNDDKHNFKQRAEALLTKWAAVQQPDAKPPSGMKKSTPPQPDTNGAAAANHVAADTSAADVGDLTEVPA